MPETPKDIWFEPYRRPYTDRAGDLVASVVEQVTSYEVAKKLQKRCGKTGARTLQLGLDCLHLTLDARSNGRQLMKCCAFRKFPAFSQKQRLFETTMDKEILTVREVAAYLKIKEKTAYRLAAEGKNPRI